MIIIQINPLQTSVALRYPTLKMLPPNERRLFFISYSTVPEPTLRHYRRNSLTQLMLISTALKPVFNLKVNKSLPGLLLNAYCDPYKQTMPFFNFFCFFFTPSTLKLNTVYWAFIFELP